VHRQEDDSDVRAVTVESLERLKAVEHGHGDVQDDHVGPEAQGQVERLTAVARTADDVKSGSKKAADEVQECDVIVYEQDARPGGRWDLQSDVR
jgi:hypothetical protein